MNIPIQYQGARYYCMPSQVNFLRFLLDCTRNSNFDEFNENNSTNWGRATPSSPCFCAALCWFLVSADDSHLLNMAEQSSSSDSDLPKLKPQTLGEAISARLSPNLPLLLGLFAAYASGSLGLGLFSVVVIIWVVYVLFGNWRVVVLPVVLTWGAFNALIRLSLLYFRHKLTQSVCRL